MRDLDIKGLMQEVLNGEIPSSAWLEFGRRSLDFKAVQIEGNLVDVLCKIRNLDRGTVGFLHQEVSTLID